MNTFPRPLIVGTICKPVQLIHSAPDSKPDSTPRMLCELREGVPKHWSVRRRVVRRTPSGSMTRKMFNEWSKFFTRNMVKDGYGSANGNPLILLIDGHTSRWTYEGIHVPDPLCPWPSQLRCPMIHTPHTSQVCLISWKKVSSHFSSRHIRPLGTNPMHDNGINASYKAKFFASIKRWRHRHPFSVYDRVAFIQPMCNRSDCCMRDSAGSRACSMESQNDSLEICRKCWGVKANRKKGQYSHTHVRANGLVAIAKGFWVVE